MFLNENKGFHLWSKISRNLASMERFLKERVCWDYLGILFFNRVTLILFNDLIPFFGWGWISDDFLYVIELFTLDCNRLTYQHIVVGVKVFSVWLSSAGDGSMIALYIEITPCIVWIQNKIWIPESFKTNISHQLFFFYKITYVNSQRENTNSKGDFVLKNLF